MYSLKIDSCAASSIRLRTSYFESGTQRCWEVLPMESLSEAMGRPAAFATWRSQQLRHKEFILLFFLFVMVPVAFQGKARHQLCELRYSCLEGEMSSSDETSTSCSSPHVQRTGTNDERLYAVLCGELSCRRCCYLKVRRECRHTIKQNTTPGSG